MVNKTGGEKTVEELKSELEKIELQQKISEAKKKKAEADKALEPVSELEKARQLAEANKVIAEANKAALKAQLPDFGVKAPEGNLTVDDNVAIECQILTYKAVSEIAFQLSTEIQKTTPTPVRVIICDQNDINALFSYKAFKAQTTLLKDQYAKALEEEKKTETKKFLSGAGADIAMGIGATALNFVSLFKTDTEIKGKKVDISDEALIAETARALKLKGITTIYPAFINTPADKLLNDVSELSGLKEKADLKITEWGTNSRFADKVTQLKNLNKQYEKTLTSLAGVDEKTGTSRLEKLIKGETLSTELDKDGTDILYLNIAAGGGNNKTTRNLLWSQLTHSGGAVITYFLLDKEGSIKASKTFYNATGYKKFESSDGKIGLNNFNSM